MTATNPQHVDAQGTVRKRAPRLRRQAAPSPIQLTSRDFEVLRSLALHRILSGCQLQRLNFACSESRSRRRLRALFDHGLIERIPIAARPASELPPFVYTLSSRGAAALQEIDEVVPRRQGVGCSLHAMRHRLAVAEFYVALTEAIAQTPGMSLQNWSHEELLRLPRVNGQSMPERVRHPMLHKALPFLPDAYFQVRVNDGATLAYFLEIDLATHAHRVWRERAKLYMAYADPQTGLFRRRFGRENFRLLIVTTNDYRKKSRCRNVLTTIHETVGASELFLGTTLSRITAEQVLAPIWLRPGHESHVPLLHNPSSRGTVVVTRGRVRSAS